MRHSVHLEVEVEDSVDCPPPEDRPALVTEATLVDLAALPGLLTGRAGALQSSDCSEVRSPNATDYGSDSSFVTLRYKLY